MNTRKEQVRKMSKVQCWDVVEDLINEASKRFKPLYLVNEEKLGYVKKICKTVIQEATDNNYAEVYEVEVDEITMEIRVSVEFENLPTRIFLFQSIWEKTRFRYFILEGIGGNK